MIYDKAQIIDIPKGKSVCCIAPHPDDEIIGCGGILAKHIEHGDKVFVFYLSTGNSVEERNIRLKELQLGLAQLGISDYYLGNEIQIKLEEKLINIFKERKPVIIYLPHINDRHIEHFRANVILCNVLKKYLFDVHIACYEVWGTLNPTHIVNISDYFQNKIDAINQHISQCELYNYQGMITHLARYRLLAARPNKKMREIAMREILFRKRNGKECIIPWTTAEAIELLNRNKYLEKMEIIKRGGKGDSCSDF